MENLTDTKKIKRRARNLFLLIILLLLCEVITFSQMVIPEWLVVQGFLVLLFVIGIIIVSVFLAAAVNRLAFGKLPRHLPATRFKKMLLFCALVFVHLVVAGYLAIFGAFRISSYHYITRSCYENGDCLYLYHYHRPLDFDLFGGNDYDFRIWKQERGSIFLSEVGPATPIQSAKVYWIDDSPRYYLGYTCSGNVASVPSRGWLDRGQSCVDGIAFTCMGEQWHAPESILGSWKVTYPVVPYNTYEREHNFTPVTCCHEMHFTEIKGFEKPGYLLEMVNVGDDPSYKTQFIYDNEFLKYDDKTFEVYALHNNAILLFQLPSSADSLYGELYYRNVLKLERF